MILFTGQRDRGNLVASNGGADGVTDSRHIICKAVFAKILLTGRFFVFSDGLEINSFFYDNLHA
jgi:hypothetical protein